MPMKALSDGVIVSFFFIFARLSEKKCQPRLTNFFSGTKIDRGRAVSLTKNINSI